MMFLLKDMRDYIATLGIAVDNNCYCGKMADKKDMSIGVYNLKSRRKPIIPIGGIQNKSYETKGISILIHWTESPTQTEVTAINLYKALQQCDNVAINNKTIKWIHMMYDEPISVDTDENGIFEYVIECLLYLERTD